MVPCLFILRSLGFSTLLGMAQQRTFAVCVFQSLPGSPRPITGYAAFKEEAGNFDVYAQISGLPPGSSHGFHVHEWGDLTSQNGSAAGGHYNPMNVPHACPPKVEHVGDLGNLKADSAGNTVYRATFPVSEKAILGRNGVIGRGMIIHADLDDCTTQPTGNSGARWAQCVVGFSSVYYGK